MYQERRRSHRRHRLHCHGQLPLVTFYDRRVVDCVPTITTANVRVRIGAHTLMSITGQLHKLVN